VYFTVYLQLTVPQYCLMIFFYGDLGSAIAMGWTYKILDAQCPGTRIVTPSCLTPPMSAALLSGVYFIVGIVLKFKQIYRHGGPVFSLKDGRHR
jgi:hypothetical protein